MVSAGEKLVLQEKQWPLAWCLAKYLRCPLARKAFRMRKLAFRKEEEKIRSFSPSTRGEVKL